jgi:type II secretory ATPase GspE/PulE/Tfp pilus assembly ATPase PilB-like protein
VLFALKAEGLAGEDAQFRDVRVARATGCSQCSDGYKGNIGLQEVVVEGETRGLNIVEDALFKAAAGLTTIDEVAGLVQQL